jgi:hypothetical protein
MFIAALFTIAKLWKQPRCPTMTNGLRKFMYCVFQYIINTLFKMLMVQIIIREKSNIPALEKKMMF